MTTEQKARAYDEALKVANKYKDTNIMFPSIKEEMFPVLKERIRKAIEYAIGQSTHSDGTLINGVSSEEAIAWLEKQGELVDSLSKGLDNAHERIDELIQKNNSLIEQLEKPEQKYEPEFHEGEWVFIEEVKGYKNGPFQIKAVDSFGYSFDEYHTIPFMYEELLSKWSIKDAKDGDILFSSSTASHEIFMFKSIDKKENVKCYFTYDSEDGFIEGKYHFIGKAIKCKPATKEQQDFLMKAMADARYTFDFEKKELKKVDNEEVNGEDYGIDGLWHAQAILEKTLGKVDGYQTDDGILEHKAAITAVKKLYERETNWSEEDERMLFSVIWHLRDSVNNGDQSNSAGKLEPWIRTLKDRVQHQLQWTPSDEQMDAIRYVSNFDYVGHKATLVSLYEQLKKLKGE